MPDSKQEDSFRVIDRRLFNAEGELRDEAAEERRKNESEHTASTPLNSPAATASKRDSASPASRQPDSKSAPAPAAAPEAAEPEGPAPSRGFQMLINFVAQNAAMLLGAYPDPRSGQPMLDLEGARELIDMLDALREASRGNVAPDDERLLLDVIGSLKLSFMEMTKAAAKAMQEKAKARP